MWEEQTAYIVLVWFYIVLTLCFVLNRLYVRVLRRTEVLSRRRALANWSDSLVVLAWLLNLAQSTLDTYLYTHNVMINADDLDLSLAEDRRRLELSKKIYYIENIIYIPLYCIKGAILCFLLEITPARTSSSLRRAIWLGFVFLVVGFAFTGYTYVCACHPSGVEWDKICNFTTVSGILYHVITDIYIYAIPFFLVKNLKIITWSQKLATATMFGAGFALVCFAVPQALCSALPGRFPLVMWSFWWGLHEQSLAVCVACLPSLRITMQRWSRVRVSQQLRNDDEEDGRGNRKSNKAWRGDLTTREVVGDTFVLSEIQSNGDDRRAAGGGIVTKSLSVGDGEDGIS